MKKPFILLALVCLSLPVKAQTPGYRPVYLGIGGFRDVKGAYGDLALEVRGRASDLNRFFVGVRFQLAATPISGYSSICLAGDYYFCRPENRFRLFAGAGVGGFNDFKVPNTNEINFFNLNASNLGFFPRLGIEAGRFRLSAEYNFTGGTDNYAAVNVGILIGGGKNN